MYSMTCNLTLSGLGGSSAQTNRDYGVIETDKQDVAEAARNFQADWNHTTYQPGASHMLVSPDNARAGILGVISGAQKTLRLGDEEMYDRAWEDALIAAAKRGVNVELVLPTADSDDPSFQGNDITRLIAN